MVLRSERRSWFVVVVSIMFDREKVETKMGVVGQQPQTRRGAHRSPEERAVANVRLLHVVLDYWSVSRNFDWLTMAAVAVAEATQRPIACATLLPSNYAPALNRYQCV